MWDVGKKAGVVPAFSFATMHACTHADRLAHKHTHKWGRRGEHEPTLPAYRRTTSPSPPSAPRGPRCARLQHLRVRERGTWGRKGPCDTAVRQAACMPCDTSGARMPAAVPEFPARILLRQRPLRPTTSLASKARATAVRTAHIRRSFVSSHKREGRVTGNRPPSFYGLCPTISVCQRHCVCARGRVGWRGVCGTCGVILA